VDIVIGLEEEYVYRYREHGESCQSGRRSKQYTDDLAVVPGGSESLGNGLI
jgi:hypothetical protein